MNWPEAFVVAVAIVGVCSCIMAIALRRSVVEPERRWRFAVPEPPPDEREKMPGLRAPGEYRVAYTPRRVDRGSRKRKGGVQ